MSVASSRGAPGQRPEKKEPTFGKVRKPLKKGKRQRHMNQNDYLRCLGAAKSRQGGRCVALMAGIEHECGDHMEFLHCVDQTVIVSRHGKGHPALSDERMGAYGCRWTNNSLDDWRGPLRDLQTRRHLMTFFHPEMEQALKQYGLTYEYERKINGAG